MIGINLISASSNSGLPGVQVFGAGDSAIDGLYTYRGESGGFHYYNLEVWADDPTTASIFCDGKWHITNDHGNPVYETGLSSTEFPYDLSNTWLEAGGAAPVPSVAQA